MELIRTCPRRDSGRKQPVEDFLSQRTRRAQRTDGRGAGFLAVLARLAREFLGAGFGNPFSRGDAEGAEDVPPGSDPGRGRAAERGGFINYRTDPILSSN